MCGMENRIRHNEANRCLRDPKDERYLNLAIAVGARYLVSRDTDLLDLMKDQPFRNQFPHLNILDPTAFLQAMIPRTDQS
jgi:predicted nucleic acid-binding protein